MQSKQGLVNFSSENLSLRPELRRRVKFVTRTGRLAVRAGYRYSFSSTRFSSGKIAKLGAFLLIVVYFCHLFLRLSHQIGQIGSGFVKS